MGSLFSVISGLFGRAGRNARPDAPQLSRDDVTAALAHPRTAQYQPSLPVQALADQDAGLYLPYQFYGDVERMVAHPAVLSPYALYRSGLAGAEFEAEASDAESMQFALDTAAEFWERSLPEAQLAYDYGWVGAEVLYRLEQGRLRFDGLKAFAPRDVVPLTAAGEYLGLRVRNLTDAAGGPLTLWGPRHAPAKGFWYAHRPRYHPWYGRSQLWPAWRPWRRLATRDATEEVIDGAVYREGYQGPTVYFPPGSSASDRHGPGAERQDNRDIAAQMAVQIKAGASMAFPYVPAPDGGSMWRVEWPQKVIDVGPLIDAAKYLKDEISLGIGVPPEILQASDTGSGYSGRAVPLEGYYLGQQEVGRAILEAFCRQILSPLLLWNVGPGAWARVKLKSLLETRQRKAQAAAPQQPADAPGQGGGGLNGAAGRQGAALLNGNGRAQFQMATDAAGHEHKGKGPGGGEFTSAAGVSRGVIPDAPHTPIAGHDTFRRRVTHPDRVAGAPKTKKGRKELAKALQDAYAEARNALAVKYGTRDIEAAMSPEEKALDSHLFFGRELVATGRGRDGPNDLGPVADEHYARHYRNAIKALDRLRQLAATPAAVRMATGANAAAELSTNSPPAGVRRATNASFSDGDPHSRCGGERRPRDIESPLQPPHTSGRGVTTFSTGFDESKHPRGQPENEGEFGPGGGGTAPSRREERKARRKQARKDFAAAVAGVFGGKADGDEAAVSEAGRSLYLEYRPEDHSVFVDFTQAPSAAAPSAKQSGVTGWDATAQAVQPGTVDLAHKLTDFCRRMAGAGVGISYETTEPRRRRLYARMLTAAGFVEGKSDDPEESLWRPMPVTLATGTPGPPATRPHTSARGRSLARHYADLWNLLESAGREVGHDDVAVAAAELADGGWAVEKTPGGWRAVPHDAGDGADDAGGMVRLSTDHAPVGGVTLQGKFFRGGQFIPSAVIASLSKADQKKLADAKQAAKAKRVEAHAHKLPGLADKLKQYAGVALSEKEQKSARLALAQLHRHHGDATLHRVSELAEQLEDALAKVPADEEGLRGQFGRRLAALHAMLGEAGKKGIGPSAAPALPPGVGDFLKRNNLRVTPQGQPAAAPQPAAPAGPRLRTAADEILDRAAAPGSPLYDAAKAEPPVSRGVALTPEHVARIATVAARTLPATVGGAAYDPTSGDWNSHKVLLSDVYDAAKGRLGGMTLGQFKDALWQAHLSGHAELGRLDMTGAVPDTPAGGGLERQGQSEINRGDATFHTVNAHGAAARKALAGSAAKPSGAESSSEAAYRGLTARIPDLDVPALRSEFDALGLDKHSKADLGQLAVKLGYPSIAGESKASILKHLRGVLERKKQSQVQVDLIGPPPGRRLATDPAETPDEPQSPAAPEDATHGEADQGRKSDGRIQEGQTPFGEQGGAEGDEPQAGASHCGERTEGGTQGEVTLATAHAPPGGIAIQGQQFTGGEFIPAADVAKATESQKKAIADGGKPPSGKPAKTPAKRGAMAPARREGQGKDARLVLADGSPAPAHVAAGKIPPQWKDVTVSLDPDADVLATGRDAAGRAKVIYRDEFHMRNAAHKFARTRAGLEWAGELHKQNQANRADPKLREEADCTWLMQEQATRPGSDKDTAAKVKAFGATTLREEHVVETGDGVRLQFVGKEGVYHDHLVRNPELAEMLLARKATAGSRGGRLFDTDYAAVAKYAKSLDTGRFTPKDFRTIRANQLAIAEIAKAADQPANEKEYKARVKAVAERVSGVLGNRPAQALESYIDPAVFSAWKVANA